MKCIVVVLFEGDEGVETDLLRNAQGATMYFPNMDAAQKEADNQGEAWYEIHDLDEIVPQDVEEEGDGA